MSNTPRLIAQAIIENRYRQTELVVLAEAYLKLLHETEDAARHKLTRPA